MIPVDGSFPNLEWPSLLALEAGGEQARAAVSQELSVVAHLPASPTSQDQLLLMRLTPEARCLFDENC